MDDVFSARDTSAGEFGPDPGPPKFLKIPADATRHAPAMAISRMVPANAPAKVVNVGIYHGKRRENFAGVVNAEHAFPFQLAEMLKDICLTLPGEFDRAPIPTRFERNGWPHLWS